MDSLLRSLRSFDSEWRQPIGIPVFRPQAHAIHCERVLGEQAWRDLDRVAVVVNAVCIFDLSAEWFVYYTPAFFQFALADSDLAPSERQADGIFSHYTAGGVFDGAFTSSVFNRLTSAQSNCLISIGSYLARVGYVSPLATLLHPYEVVLSEFLGIEGGIGSVRYAIRQLQFTQKQPSPLLDASAISTLLEHPADSLREILVYLDDLDHVEADTEERVAIAQHFAMPLREILNRCSGLDVFLASSSSAMTRLTLENAIRITSRNDGGSQTSPV